MSDMPARIFREASRSQQPQTEHAYTSTPWSQHASAPKSTSSRIAAQGPPSPRSPLKRPWESSTLRSNSSAGHDSVEEDELSEELPPPRHGDRHPRLQRLPSKTPKKAKVTALDTSPKSSKRVADDFPPAAKNAEDSHATKVSSRGSSPREQISTSSANPQDSESSRSSERILSPNEIDAFLDLIYKHHPEPMTAEAMRQSVDALYADWEQLCARRRVPVRLTKKPLMDEYGKIFNGIYGADAQAKAQSIAHELSQRTANSSSNRETAGDNQEHRRDSGSRYSGTHSMTDPDTDDDEGDHGADDQNADIDDDTTAADAGMSTAPSLASKQKADRGQDTAEGKKSATSAQKSNIAQVGRNGLAVLPPGLFDILRTHLRDDILSSIMPSVRNDLTEQTRELFLQNQDLFGRIKEMEDRIRNQDLWIRHLLSRDPTDTATPPVGSHLSATGMASADTKSRPISASARESAKFGKPFRHEPTTSSEGELGIGMPSGDYFVGPGPTSPRQDPRYEPRHLPPQQGMAGPAPPFEGRMPPAAHGPAFAAAGEFGSGQWESNPHPAGAFQDRPPNFERRPSYANEPPHRRPESWQSDVPPGRDLRHHPTERFDQPEGRYEPPLGSHFGPQRHSFGEPRRLSTLSGGSSGLAGAGPRSTHIGPGPPASTGSPPSMGSMHDEFRRPGPLMHSRESLMSPLEPAYETRRAHPGLPASQSEPYFGGSEAIKAPLPPRALAAGSPEQMQRNKRGRPSKAEMASSRGGELGPGSSHASFGAGAHPSMPPRPYLS